MSDDKDKKTKKEAKKIVIPSKRPSEVRDSIRELEAEFYRNYIDITRENRDTDSVRKRASNVRFLLNEYEQLDKKASKMIETGEYTIRGLLSREKLIMRNIQQQVNAFDDQVEAARKMQAKKGKKKKTFPDEYAWCSNKTGRNPSVTLEPEFDVSGDIVFVDKHVNWDEPDEPDFTGFS